MKIQALLSCLALSCFSACSMNNDVLTPDTEIASLDRTQSDLAVWIDSAIPNEFRVNSAGFRDVEFKNYRMSLESAFGTTFSQYFHGVYFTDHVPSKGVMVKLSKAAPQPIATRSNSTVQQVGMQITWSGEIYRDGERVRHSEGKVLSDERAGGLNANRITNDALRLMTEQFGSEIRAIADGADPVVPATPVVKIPAKKRTVTAAPKKVGLSSGSAGL